MESIILIHINVKRPLYAAHNDIILVVISALLPSASGTQELTNTRSIVLPCLS